MQRNTIRVSVRGGDNRISENMLRNVLNSQSDGCECENEGMRNVRDTNHSYCEYPSLAMVYAPYQKWHQLYDMDTALMCGTLFQELNKPFEGARGGCSGSGRGGKGYGM